MDSDYYHREGERMMSMQVDLLRKASKLRQEKS